MKHLNPNLKKLINLDRKSKNVLLASIDCTLIVLCYFLATALRLEGINFIFNPKIWIILVPIIPLSIFVFSLFGLYRAVNRFISFDAFFVIFKSVIVSAISILLISQLLSLPVPRSVPIIYAFILFTFISGVRFSIKPIIKIIQKNIIENILVFGAGESGSQLVKFLKDDGNLNPIAFVDSNNDFHKRNVSGLTVYSPSEIKSLIKNYNISTILISIEDTSRSIHKSITDNLKNIPIKVRQIHNFSDIVSGKITVSDLKTVYMEDLLGRKPIYPKENLLKKNIKDKIVMITGAGGSIGSELCRQILIQQPNLMILCDVSEYSLYKINDELQQNLVQNNLSIQIHPLLGTVQNIESMKMIINLFNVQTVYHAAAYKHVPLVEQNIIEAIRNNIFGTLNIAKAAIEADVESFILISTDKAVRPTNIMGATKRMAEIVCQSLSHKPNKTKFSIVRFGNVLGSSGSVVPKFVSQIKKGGPVTVTHPDITRYFMTISEAAQLVIQAGAMSEGGDVFVLDMGKPIKIIDLAIRMINLNGLSHYIAEQDHKINKNNDSIPIIFTGLRSGEKLYEDLLIGNNPSGTEHSRIMKAKELFIKMSELEDLLNNIQLSCDENNIGNIIDIFLNSPLDYNFNNNLTDIIWQNNKDKYLLNDNVRELKKIKKY